MFPDIFAIVGRYLCTYDNCNEMENKKKATVLFIIAHFFMAFFSLKASLAQ